jgi:hypothetical protein
MFDWSNFDGEEKERRGERRRKTETKNGMSLQCLSPRLANNDGDIITLSSR